MRDSKKISRRNAILRTTGHFVNGDESVYHINSRGILISRQCRKVAASRHSSRGSSNSLARVPRHFSNWFVSDTYARWRVIHELARFAQIYPDSAWLGVTDEKSSSPTEITEIHRVQALIPRFPRRPPMLDGVTSSAIAAASIPANRERVRTTANLLESEEEIKWRLDRAQIGSLDISCRVRDSWLIVFSLDRSVGINR